MRQSNFIFQRMHPIERDIAKEKAKIPRNSRKVKESKVSGCYHLPYELVGYHMMHISPMQHGLDVKELDRIVISDGEAWCPTPEDTQELYEVCSKL